jgi:hypothetical protein
MRLVQPPICLVNVTPGCFLPQEATEISIHTSVLDLLPNSNANLGAALTCCVLKINPPFPITLLA